MALTLGNSTKHNARVPLVWILRPGIGRAPILRFFFDCCFAENYPPPAHNKNSEPMSNSAHIVIHRTPHPAQVFVAQRKSSAMALFARIIPSPQLRKAMQTTRFFRGRINRNPFRSKDFRVIVLAMVNFHRFPNLQGSTLHQFPNFLWFAALSFLTFDSEFYPSLRKASI